MASSKPWNSDIESSRSNLRDFLINGNSDRVSAQPTKTLVSSLDEKRIVSEQARSAFTDEWWKLHPALTAVREIEPALNAAIRRNPLSALAIGAVAGGALVFAKPWRNVNVRTLTNLAATGTGAKSVLAAAALAALNQYSKKS